MKFQQNTRIFNAKIGDAFVTHAWRTIIQRSHGIHSLHLQREQRTADNQHERPMDLYNVDRTFEFILFAGSPVEALCQGLMAAAGELHHEGTRISIRPDENHGMTTAIPSFFGAPPSCNQLPCTSFSDDLLGVPGIRRYASNNGTLRGHRNNLWNFKRTGLAPSEVTETYKTSKSGDGAPLSQFAQKSHVNKWCHSEPDRSVRPNA